MSISALQEYTRLAKYAIYLPEKGRRENWDEQIDRIMQMHRTKFSHLLPAIEPYLDFIEQKLRRKEILGSQRILQFGGEPALKKNLRVYNCSFSFIDRPRVFQEYMYTLLCGAGVGFSVQKHHVAKLPKISAPSPLADEEVFVVPDNIEGWADAIGALLSSFFVSGAPFPEYKGKYIRFDYSQIRPEGAPISVGAKAPGPKGLMRSIEKVRELLHNICLATDTLRPIHVYDILMHISDAVISGGVRRSATIAIFSADDEEMASAKTGDWQITNPQRARSNNSALLLRDKTSYEEFYKFIQWTKERGEPGFFWSDSTEIGANPCVEASFHPVDEETGESGWQACNLSEINGKKIKTEEQFYEACRAAGYVGTLQAAYTDFPYLGEVSERIIRREALLGVSVTGMMDSPEILFSPEVQRKGAKVVLQANEELARILGINATARATCIKPSGTASAILGTSSGIHPHHASRYFRRVQANRQETPAQFFESHNPRAVEHSVWDPNGVTKVLTFLCEVPRGSKIKNQIGALDLLEKVLLTQSNWVTAGTVTERCTIPGVKHNVSNTITVKEDEWEAVARFIYDHRDAFTGVSLIPHSGDKDYPQAPFCAVPYPRDILFQYGPGSLFASGIITSALDSFGDLWDACATLLGVGKSADTYGWDAMRWCERAHQYAERYFENDLRKMTYCLKDVYNLKLWEDLSREYKDVPWEEMREMQDEVDFAAEAACAGGACEMPAEYLEAIRKS